MQKILWLLFSLAWFCYSIAVTAAPVALAIPAGAQQFTIRLAANPTTGYQWSLVSYDQKVIKPISHAYTPTVMASIGAGGTDSWLFQIVDRQAQTTDINFQYARPWNQQDQPSYSHYLIKFNPSS